LKLDIILAQYLYQHKSLNLPGIGTFTLNGSSFIPDDSAKVKAPIEGIDFTTESKPLAEDNLIDFIRIHTGKMKPLAQADLESFIMLSQQFINIGKPLYLEGIGTIQKIKNSIEFIPGKATNVKLEPIADRTMETRLNEGYDEYSTSESRGGGSQRKLILLLSIIGTLALLAFGGYYLYNKNNQSSPVTTIPDETSRNVVSVSSDTAGPLKTQPDTLSQFVPASGDSLIKKDSSTTTNTTATPAYTRVTSSYTFVIEHTNNKARALSRLAKLKSYGYPILLSTKDSVNFKLYFSLAATPTDTARIRDSLNGLFNIDATTKKLLRRTTIEN
jgi:hypothetical protein